MSQSPDQPPLYYERRLPHWQPAGRFIFLTWRLYGSLPRSVLATLQANKSQTTGKRFVQFDRHLDVASAGPFWLRQPAVASAILAAIRSAEHKGFCHVHAWVIMPNHVHLLIQPKTSLANITRTIKGSSSRAANLLLRRTGRYFWQEESFDRWIRNEGEFAKVRKYIERNPITAGLVKHEQDWPWSSASK